MVKMTKLDSYDYILLPGAIMIEVSGVSDPVLVDVMSEIENSDDLIFVEGRYYEYIREYEIFKEENSGKHYLSIRVIEIISDRLHDILTIGDE